MLPASHSRTAHGAAAHRAVHQTLEQGRIFRDPFAMAILGPAAEPILKERSEPQHRPMRLFLAARSRLAEDALADAVGRGLGQAVILGAGLDTFALRNPFASLTIFEVDHPASQAAKRRALEVAELEIPVSLRFAPVDFERQNFLEELAKVGFDSMRPAFFVWLGVVPYLSREAISATLDQVARLPRAEILFDYSEPLENYPPERRAHLAALAARVAAIGEPWLSHFDPAEATAMMRARGFDEIEDIGLDELARRFGDFAGITTNVGPHVLRARRYA